MPAIRSGHHAGSFSPRSCSTALPLLPSSRIPGLRRIILVLLIAVLPLHSVGQWLNGLQAHRHIHLAAVAPSALARLWERLHAAQDPRLAALAPAASLPGASRGGEWHEHGGVAHRHGRHEAGTVELAQAGDDAGLGGATAFLAWLPVAPAVAAPDVRPSVPEFIAQAWRGRVVAPPLAPPRG